MIVQIGSLFVNTDNIVTLSYVEHKGENETDFGIQINNHKYILYSVKNDDTEKQDKVREKVSGVVATLVNSYVNPVQRLKLEEDNVKVQ